MRKLSYGKGEKMREILFRGKRIDNGDWVYGFFWKDIWGDGESCYILFDNEDFPVIPETVGQYTGLKDKDGKKIFEGDILISYFRSNHSKQKFFVTFDDAMFLFDNMCVKVPKYEIYCMQIIGNIFDNPELLEDKED